MNKRFRDAVYAGVLAFGALTVLWALLVVFFPQNARAQEPLLDSLSPYISAGVTASHWPDRSNQDGLEADSSIGPGGRVAGGFYVFDYARIEIEAGYGREDLHGFNDPGRGIEGTLDGHVLNVATVMLGAGLEYRVTDWISLYGMAYAGGAYLFSEGPDYEHERITPAFQGRVGALIETPLEDLRIDTGLGYLYTLPFEQQGIDVKYDSAFAYLGAQYRF